MRRLARVSAALIVLASSAPAPAEAPPAPAGEAPPPAYDQHMAAGRKLVDDESWAAAQAEFEAAYAAAPRAAPLLQVAACQRALQRWSEAIATMERALRDHGGTLDDAERRTAEKDLAELRAEVGKVQVVIWPAAATLRVDGEDQPPAGPQRVITVGPGPHRLEARLPGWSPAALTVTVSSGETVAVKLGVRPRVEGSPASDGSPGAPPTEGPRRVRGPYGLLGFTTFVPLPPSDFSGTALGFSGGVRLGYRFASFAGAELLIDYAHAAASGQGKPSFADTPDLSAPFSYALSSLRAGLGVRLMTTGRRVRFVQLFGGGLANDSIRWTPGAGAMGLTRQGASGADGFGISESGVEVDLSGVLLGLTLQQVVGSRGALTLAQHDEFSAETYGGPQYSMGLGIRGGYRLW